MESTQATPNKAPGFSVGHLTIPFFMVHIIAGVGVFVVGFRWEWLLLCVAMYYMRMFGTTAGYHRYFSHKTYKTSRIFQFMLALLGTLAVQKGVLWWSSIHRDHHRYSDEAGDPHSPRAGVYWSHMGWILTDKFRKRDYERNIKDFNKYPELRLLDRFHIVPVIAFASIIWLIGGWGALIWGFFLSTTLLWHGTFMVNSITHIFGRVRFDVGDDSKNNALVALATMGEGWHNNHHFHQASVRQGWYWWEIDVTYYLLKVLSWFGVVWDLRLPPATKVELGAQLNRQARADRRTRRLQAAA